MRNSVQARIGKNIRRLRLARNLSQAALAEQVGIGEKAMGVIERGGSSVDVDRLAGIATALQCDVADLVAASTSAGRARTFVIRASDLKRLETALRIVESVRRERSRT